MRKTLGNGAYSIYTYDTANSFIKLENFLPDQTLSNSNLYEYDLKERVIKMTDLSNQSWVYGYDVAGRLSRWRSSNGENVLYFYDNRGNRLMTQIGNSTARYSVNRLNQYTSYNDNEQFSYDPNGNLVRKVTTIGTEAYEYDAEGRLVLTQTPNDR